jgi:chromosome segregation ATPase
MVDTSRFNPEPPRVSDTKIMRRDGPLRFLRFLDDVIAFRNRIQALEAARFDQQRTSAVEAAVRKADAANRGLPAEEQKKRRIEAMRMAESDEASNRQIFEAKLAKFDSEVKALNDFLYAVGPAWEKSSGLQDLEKRIRADEEQLGAAQAQLAIRAAEVESREKAALEKARQAEALLARLDVSRRAQELDQREEEVNAKFKAYEPEMAELVRAREELNRDFDQLGLKRAELDKEADRLEAREIELARQKENLVDALAEEMAVPFKAFVRDLLKPKAPPSP